MNNFQLNQQENTISNSIIKVPLDIRMKQYEDQSLSPDYIVKNDEYFIIRLDGRSFSRFTSGLKKPFDKLFIKAMCYTSADLLEEFKCKTSYCHSDEITLIFSRQYPNEKGIYTTSHIFNGRIQKLLSLTASYCSVRFNHHLNLLFEMDKSCNDTQYSKSIISKILESKQMFDSRIIIFNELNNYEIVNHQIWRSTKDCYRNAVQAYGYYYIGYKQLMCKDNNHTINMLEQHNIIWNNIPTYIKYGVYCKKELINSEINDKKFTRSKTVFKNFKISFSENMLNLLLAKYWSCADNSIEELISEELNIDDI